MKTIYIDPGKQGLWRLLSLLVNAQKIVILVILYSIANVLSYSALARVDAALYTVLLQLKILTTAAFSVLFLGRNISGAKWRALILLVFGCILVASPVFEREEDPNIEQRSIFEVFLGIGSVLIMVTISGYTAVYFESMLKKESMGVWERNFQLAFYSVVLLLIIVVSDMTYTNTEAIEEGAFTPTISNTASYHAFLAHFPKLFRGWTINAFLLALIQAGGGLLVATSLKYADSILKTLATSGSIVLSAGLGYLFMGADLDIFVCIGCCCTILSICNYSMDATD